MSKTIVYREHSAMTIRHCESSLVCHSERSEESPPSLFCHCEPFTLCHSERSEESRAAQDKLRVAISIPSPLWVEGWNLIPIPSPLMGEGEGEGENNLYYSLSLDGRGRG